MNDFDLYDFLGHYSYHARALRRPDRGGLYVRDNHEWFEGMNSNAVIVLKSFGHQFARGGTDALETPAFWDVPEIKFAGGLDALRVLGKPVQVMQEAKVRLFTV